MLRRSLMGGGVALLAFALVGCTGDAGPAADWWVEASEAEEGWFYMDGNSPRDDELFQLAISATAIPAGDYEAAVEVAVDFALESEGDSGGAGQGSIEVSLSRGGELVASGSASGGVGALETITLVDDAGIQACGEGNACVFDYTLEATLDGEGLYTFGDVTLTAWIDGAGETPPDAQLTFALF